MGNPQRQLRLLQLACLLGTQRPFIVQDGTGFSQIGCYGSPIATPNIDRGHYTAPVSTATAGP
jgi:hypothetical protein